MSKKDKKTSKDNNKKEKHSLVAKIVFFLFIIFDIVITIPFVISFIKTKGLNNIISNASSSISSDSIEPIIYEDPGLDERLKDILRREIENNGFDNDTIDNIYAVTYEDHHPYSFNVSFSASSATRVYYYQLTDCAYIEEGYDNCIAFLINNNKMLTGTAVLEYEEKTDDKITTNKVCSYVISKSLTEEKHFTGYYYENNEFRVYQKTSIVEEANPFDKPADIIIKSDDPLYNYYQFINQGR